jgi:hypothetical protein
VISGWPETYLGDSELSLVGFTLDDSLVSNFGGVDIGGGHAGSSKRGTGAGVANAGDDDKGAGPAGADTDGEWCRPYQG